MKKRSLVGVAIIVCLVASSAFASGTVWSEVLDDVAYVLHDNARFNCCPEFITWSDHDSTDYYIINIYELDTLHTCNCMCYYDFSCSFKGLAPGVYTANVWEAPYEYFELADTTQFTILAQVSPSGVSSSVSPCHEEPGISEEAGPKVSLESTPLVQQSVEIRFSLRERAKVTLEIYDVQGSRVRTLEAGLLEAGEHKAVWDTRNDSGVQVSRGTYFVRLVAGTSARSLPLLVLR